MNKHIFFLTRNTNPDIVVPPLGLHLESMLILRVNKITGRKCPIILYLEDIPKNCYAQETELQEIAMIQTKQTTSLIDMEFSKKTT